MDKSVREKTIVRVSVIGIIANLLLAGFKGAVGFFSNSIAITMDAVNNFTDATSSVVTIVGTKLATKQPDKNHPFGYGRIEYFTAMAVAGLVLYAGIAAIIESIEKIIKPEEPSYNTTSLIIIIVAVVVKLVLGIYVKRRGKKVKSDALVNSGQDAFFDAILSTGTVIAAIVYIAFDISVEPYLGVVISIVIINSGFDMFKETFSQLLGQSNDPELANNIKKTILEFDGVRGVYDIVLNDYGPNSHSGSLHIEVPDVYTADIIDELVRRIQTKVYNEHNIVLTAVGVYSYNTTDEEAIAIRDRITQIAMDFEHVSGIHGFYYNRDDNSIRFDVIVSFNADNRSHVFENVIEAVRDEYPDLKLYAVMDKDYTEGMK